MICSAQGRAEIRRVERLWLPKFTLRALTLLLGLLSLCLAAATFPRDLSIVWIVLPLGLSIIWNFTNIIVRLSQPRPMTPGANVGCDLIIWLSFIVLIWYLFIQSFGLLYATNSYYYGGLYDGCYGTSYYGNDDCDGLGDGSELHNLGQLAIASTIIGCAITALHFALFVWACVDVHARRHCSAEERATIMATNILRSMQAQGQWVPAQHGVAPPPGAYVPYPHHPRPQSQATRSIQGQWVPMGSYQTGKQRELSAYSPYPQQQQPVNPAGHDSSDARGFYEPEAQPEQNSARGYYEPELQVPLPQPVMNGSWAPATAMGPPTAESAVQGQLTRSQQEPDHERSMLEQARDAWRESGAGKKEMMTKNEKSLKVAKESNLEDGAAEENSRETVRRDEGDIGAAK